MGLGSGSVWNWLFECVSMELAYSAGQYGTDSLIGSSPSWNLLFELGTGFMNGSVWNWHLKRVSVELAFKDGQCATGF